MMNKTRFEHAEPILRVEDMARSIQYYVDVLGFTNAEWGGEDFTLVSRKDWSCPFANHLYRGHRRYGQLPSDPGNIRPRSDANRSNGRYGIRS